MRSEVKRALAALALAAVAVGCGAGSLDTTELEDELRRQIETELQVSGLTVECPTDVEVDAGSTFECVASDGSGNSFTIEVTQSDDEGNVAWTIVDASQ